VAEEGSVADLEASSPGVGETASLPWMGGVLAGKGETSGPEGLFSLPVDATLEKLTVDGDMKEFDGRELCVGRRGGGGAGAWMLTRRLEERERVES